MAETFGSQDRWLTGVRDAMLQAVREAEPPPLADLERERDEVDRALSARLEALAARLTRLEGGPR